MLKSDKKSVRICGDFKLTVNKAARLDWCPIPTDKDPFSEMQVARDLQSPTFHRLTSRFDSVRRLRGMWWYTPTSDYSDLLVCSMEYNLPQQYSNAPWRPWSQHWCRRSAPSSKLNRCYSGSPSAQECSGIEDRQVSGSGARLNSRHSRLQRSCMFCWKCLCTVTLKGVDPGLWCLTPWCGDSLVSQNAWWFGETNWVCILNSVSNRTEVQSNQIER